MQEEQNIEDMLREPFSQPTLPEPAKSPNTQKREETPANLEKAIYDPRPQMHSETYIPNPSPAANSTYASSFFNPRQRISRVPWLFISAGACVAAVILGFILESMYPKKSTDSGMGTSKPATEAPVNPTSRSTYPATIEPEARPSYETPKQLETEGYKSANIKDGRLLLEVGQDSLGRTIYRTTLIRSRNNSKENCGSFYRLEECEKRFNDMIESLQPREEEKKSVESGDHERVFIKNKPKERKYSSPPKYHNPGWR